MTNYWDRSEGCGGDGGDLLFFCKPTVIFSENNIAAGVKSPYIYSPSYFSKALSFLSFCGCARARVFRAGFLNSCNTDFLDWVVLCCKRLSCALLNVYRYPWPLPIRRQWFPPSKITPSWDPLLHRLLFLTRGLFLSFPVKIAHKKQLCCVSTIYIYSNSTGISWLSTMCWDQM